MDEYWDGDDQWVDESRCIVCKVRLIYSTDLVCSATCQDVLHIREGMRV